MEDILDILEDLYTQATCERSHFYVGKTCKLTITEIRNLRAENNRLINEMKKALKAQRNGKWALTDAILMNALNKVK